jgi:hypothetical protein
MSRPIIPFAYSSKEQVGQVGQWDRRSESRGKAELARVPLRQRKSPRWDSGTEQRPGDVPMGHHTPSSGEEDRR